MIGFSHYTIDYILSVGAVLLVVLSVVLSVKDRSPRPSMRESSSSLVTVETLIPEEGLEGIMVVARNKYIAREDLKDTLKCISKEIVFQFMRNLEGRNEDDQNQVSRSNPCCRKYQNQVSRSNRCYRSSKPNLSTVTRVVEKETRKNLKNMFPIVELRVDELK